ncbi:hypothetical protein BJX64DRAFT_259408 [Aspergillus heterothallicus]
MDLYGPSSLKPLKMLQSLVNALYMQGLQKESGSLAEKCYEGFKKLHGPDHMETANSLVFLARCKEGTRARDLWSLVVEGYTKLSGPSSDQTLSAKRSLLAFYIQVKQWPQARAFAQAIYAGQREKKGPLDSETMTALNEYANFSYQARDFYAARDAYQELYDRSVEIIGSGHPATLLALYMVAACVHKEALALCHGDDPIRQRRQQNKLKEARDLFQRVYQGRREALGVVHEDTEEVRRRLRWYEDKIDEFGH